MGWGGGEKQREGEVSKGGVIWRISYDNLASFTGCIQLQNGSL